MNQLLTLIIRCLNHPLFAWGTLPFSLILFGTVLGSRQTGLQLFPTILLYTFLLLTSLLERVLIKKVKKTLAYPSILNPIYWAAMLIVLLLIWTTVNWLSLGLLLLYLLFIFIAYNPALRMEQSVFYVVLQLFFKVIILGYLSYYIQTRFLEWDFIGYVIPNIFILLSLVIYRQRGMFMEEDSRYQYFIELYYLPLISISYAVGTISIIILLLVQSVTFTTVFLYALPLLGLFVLLVLKKFRISMRMDNYLNLIILITIVLYAILVQYPA